MTPASEASLARVRPRRRRGGWAIVALLLCAAVVVAIAGQANESNASPGKAAAPKPRAPAASSRPPSPPTAAAPSTTQAESPDASRVLVALGEVPGQADASEARAAVRAAMEQWEEEEEGLEMHEASGQEADIEVRFELDAADASRSRHGVAVVPLGDRGCGGAWSAYDTATVRALAARALGHAMGRDGPAGHGELMDPDIPPRYAQECEGVRDALDLSPGQSDGRPFRLGAAASVSYTVEVEGGYVDVCLLVPEDWDAFMLGEGGGAACQYGIQSASDGALLESGDHILGFRCIEASLPCHVEFTLAAQAA